MEKIVFLGTAAANAQKHYNACFAFKKNNDYMLIDSGGGNKILSQLEKASIAVTDIKSVFVTHNHIDHIFGIIWLIREWSNMMLKNDFTGTIDVYAQDITIKAIKNIAETVLNKKQIGTMPRLLNLIKVTDGEQIEILGEKFTFYDVIAEKESQYGFVLDSKGKKIIYNGDETLNETNYCHAQDVDLLIHEVIGLEADRDDLYRGGATVSTPVSVAKVAKMLDIKNLVLTHINDKYDSNRKELFIEEAKKVFNGNVFTPDDLDEIKLQANSELAS